MVFVKLLVKLWSQVHHTFALSPNSSLSFELDCESLKVPIFVVRVFFILIRNLDLQKVVCCIKQKEILNEKLYSIKGGCKDKKKRLEGNTQLLLGYWVNNQQCSFFCIDDRRRNLYTGRILPSS